MKNLMIGIAVFLFQTSFSWAFSGYHVSSMNEDVQINNALYAALKESFGSVPSVQKSDDGYFIAFGQDKLLCKISGCSLNWDVASADYPKTTASFEAALYDILDHWSQGGGKDEPALHRMVYRQTGSVRLIIDEDNLFHDQISCSMLQPTAYKQCSLNISEVTTGSADDLKMIYENLLKAPSLLDSQRQALMATVQSDLFLPADQKEFGNGTYEVVHTIYTDMLIDQITASNYYAYKVPVKNSAGQVIANGISIKFTGSLNYEGKYSLQQMQTEAYVLAHHLGSQHPL